MKHFSAAIFMGVEKAFDKVWHDGLIFTLINIGIPTIFVRYIKSFISQRYMYFQIQDLESPKIKLNFGVPQGSSLSSILFLLMSPIYQHQPNQTPYYHNSQTTLKYTHTHPALIKYNLISNTP